MHAQRGQALLLLLSLPRLLNKMARVLIVLLIVASDLVWVRAKCFMGWLLFQKVSEINQPAVSPSSRDADPKESKPQVTSPSTHEAAELFGSSSPRAGRRSGPDTTGITRAVLHLEKTDEHTTPTCAPCPLPTRDRDPTRRGPKEQVSLLEGTARKLKIRPHWV